MKVKVKTLTGILHEFEALPSDSVESVKRSIAQQTNIPFEKQKLVLGTKLLEDQVSIEETGLHEGDIVVLMTTRTAKAFPALKDSPIPTKAIILEFTSYGKKIKPTARPTAPSNPISNLRNQLQDLMGSLMGLTSPSSTEEQEVEEEEVQEEEAPVIIEVNADALRQLQEMGFTEGRSKKALLLNRMNAPLAMEWLLEHESDPDIDEPLSQDQLASVQGRTRGSATPSPATFTPDPAAVAKLKDMGFKEEDIAEALRVTNNNSEASCAYLLGEGGEAEFSMEDTNVIHDVLMNPTIQAGLANPRVLQALKALIENPSSAAQYITDPEIGPILIQVHNIISGGRH